MADQDTQRRLFSLQKIIEGRRRRRLTMQQYMLHCLQQKHKLIIQLLLLIVLILSRENATRVYRSFRRLPRSTAYLVSFFSTGPNFHCQTKSKSFLLNLTLPPVTPSWIASLSLRMLNALT